MSKECISRRKGEEKASRIPERDMLVFSVMQGRRRSRRLKNERTNLGKACTRQDCHEFLRGVAENEISRSSVDGRWYEEEELT